MNTILVLLLEQLLDLWGLRIRQSEDELIRNKLLDYEIGKHVDRDLWS